MTESEWLACTTKPMLMLRRVRDSLSPRKRQLLACALCRLLPDSSLEPWCRDAIVAAEKFAEGDLPAAEFRTVADAVRAGYDDLEIRQSIHGDVPEETIAAVTAVFNAVGTSDVMRSMPALMEYGQRYIQLTSPVGSKGKSESALRERQCHAIRELSVFPPGDYKRFFVENPPVQGFIIPGHGFFFVPEPARAIAASAHAEQAYDRLPILADALEDAGCQDARLLNHLRLGMDHFRGCWALDVVLGRG